MDVIHSPQLTEVQRREVVFDMIHILLTEDLLPLDRAIITMCKNYHCTKNIIWGLLENTIHDPKGNCVFAYYIAEDTNQLRPLSKTNYINFIGSQLATLICDLALLYKSDIYEACCVILTAINKPVVEENMYILGRFVSNFLKRIAKNEEYPKQIWVDLFADHKQHIQICLDKNDGEKIYRVFSQEFFEYYKKKVFKKK